MNTIPLAIRTSGVNYKTEQLNLGSAPAARFLLVTRLSKVDATVDNIGGDMMGSQDYWNIGMRYERKRGQPNITYIHFHTAMVPLFPPCANAWTTHRRRARLVKSA